MIQHVMLPFLDLSKYVPVGDDISRYLRSEVIAIRRSIANSISSASMFVNLEIASAILAMPSDEHLTMLERQLVVGGECRAYSEKYAKLLHRTENQWLQIDVYTEYSHWFISILNGKDNTRHKSKLVMKYANTSGLFFNPENSNTELKYRMKSEYLCQTLMALEVTPIDEKSIDKLKETIKNSKMNPYISAEYFKFRICEKLNFEVDYHSKKNIQMLISRCKADVGLCDFDSQNKTDDFMGTKKRTARDQTVFSPISTLQGVYLCKKVGLHNLADILVAEAHQYYQTNSIHLVAFKMRDVEIPFGPGVSVTEVAALHTLVTLFENR
jgi:hypothetical protein